LWWISTIAAPVSRASFASPATAGAMSSLSFSLFDGVNLRRLSITTRFAAVRSTWL